MAGHPLRLEPALTRELPPCGSERETVARGLHPEDRSQRGREKRQAPAIDLAPVSLANRSAVDSPSISPNQAGGCGVCKQSRWVDRWDDVVDIKGTMQYESNWRKVGQLARHCDRVDFRTK